MKAVTILGSTGSIGVNTLDVISRHPNQYRVFALTANTGVEKMTEQCLEWQPEYAVMADESSAASLRAALDKSPCDTQVLEGTEGLESVAADSRTDYVMAAIVGAAGLLPTLAAANAGKRVLLANKESLVVCGKVFMDAVQENRAELLPIDSEHNAIFQSLPPDFSKGLKQTGVRKILLTASGGPFRTRDLSGLTRVTPDEACAHPNWDMGRKISVDSATMMNKGLELIEACWLFGTGPENIQVVIHPQSVIHSMVEYTDGSVMAQLGNPDMRTPIAYGLAWPERIESGVESLNLFDVARLDFEEPDLQRFPCLRLASEAMNRGGTATAILNAANEIAVAEFLDEKIRFIDIPAIVESTLADAEIVEADSLEVVLAADSQAREIASIKVSELGP